MSSFLRTCGVARGEVGWEMPILIYAVGADVVTFLPSGDTEHDSAACSSLQLRDHGLWQPH